MAKVQAKTRQASMRRAFGSQEQTFLGRHQNRGQMGEGNRPYPLSSRHFETSRVSWRKFLKHTAFIPPLKKSLNWRKKRLFKALLTRNLRAASFTA